MDPNICTGLRMVVKPGTISPDLTAFTPETQVISGLRPGCEHRVGDHPGARRYLDRINDEPYDQRRQPNLAECNTRGSASGELRFRKY